VAASPGLVLQGTSAHASLSLHTHAHTCPDQAATPTHACTLTPPRPHYRRVVAQVRKEGMEKELAEVERDIKALQRGDMVMIVNE
jgi:hypothetical protein